MPVIGVPRERLMKIQEPTTSLRQGQIVQGKILNIYPNHRAEIQIGSQKMVAQLEAPLVAGEKYHFQVANTEGVVELKVIGSNLKGETANNVTQLLSELNIKASRATVEFVQSLIDGKIPFTKQQLQGALTLLNKANGSSAAQTVLREMMVRQLPMTEAVYKALLVKGSTTGSQVMTQLLAELEENQSSNQMNGKLLMQLSQVLNGKLSAESPLVQLIQPNIPANSSGNDLVPQLLQNRDALLAQMQQLQASLPTNPASMTLFDVERAKVMINQMPLPDDVKQVLLSTLEGDRAQFLNLVRSLSLPASFEQLNAYVTTQSTQEQFLSHVNDFIKRTGLAYEHNVKDTIQQQASTRLESIITQLTMQRDNIQQQASHLINRYQAFFNSDSGQLQMNDAQFNQFKQEVQTELLRLLPTEQGQALLTMLQGDNAAEKMWQLLQTLSRTDTFEQISSTLTQLNDSKATNTLTQFLTQSADLRALLQSLHIPTEFLSQNNVNESLQQSIKGQLLQLAQQNDPQFSERAQHVLHFINALQLNSVHETSHFIQASLQVPAERLGLNGDLYMDFESRKTEEGKIDSNYCRILFFLDLGKIKETVIDMNVQKRFVTLTVYNENANLDKLARPLYKPLREGLEKLDYQLSSIRFKNLLDREEKPKTDSSHKYDQASQSGGVDFRI